MRLVRGYEFASATTAAKINHRRGLPRPSRPASHHAERGAVAAAENGAAGARNPRCGAQVDESAPEARFAHRCGARSGRSGARYRPPQERRLVSIPPALAPVLVVSATPHNVVSPITRSEEHTSELQSHSDLVCR